MKLNSNYFVLAKKFISYANNSQCNGNRKFVDEFAHTNVDICAAKCQGRSKFFTFGKEGSEACRRGLKSWMCRCYCEETPDGKTCITRVSEQYDVFKLQGN